MKTINLNGIESIELDTGQLNRISGGWAELFIPLVINYIIVDIALNPKKSYNAFMAGWNSI